MDGDIKILVNSLNKSRLNDLLEERVNLSKCPNIFCTNQIPKKLKERASTSKFVFDKENGLKQIDPNEGVVILCSGKIFNSLHKNTHGKNYLCED